MALQLVERPPHPDGGRVWQAVNEQGELVGYVTEWPNGFHATRVDGPGTGPHPSPIAALATLE